MSTTIGWIKTELGKDIDRFISGCSASHGMTIWLTQLDVNDANYRNYIKPTWYRGTLQQPGAQALKKTTV